MMNEDEVLRVMAGVNAADPVWQAVLTVLGQHEGEWTRAVIAEGQSAESRHYLAGAANGVRGVREALEGMRKGKEELRRKN